MQLRIVKLDKRYKAFPHFHYYVEPASWPRVNNYLELREWFWTNYGPGCDVDMRSVYREQPDKYKWSWKDDDLRFFFQDGPELAHLQLTWIK